jgi:hypothetical protein
MVVHGLQKFRGDWIAGVRTNHGVNAAEGTEGGLVRGAIAVLYPSFDALGRKNLVAVKTAAGFAALDFVVMADGMGVGGDVGRFRHGAILSQIVKS